MQTMMQMLKFLGMGCLVVIAITVFLILVACMVAVVKSLIEKK